MFESEIANGGRWIWYHPSEQQSIAQTTWDKLLSDLENILITSNTWLPERRELIRSWTAEMLVRTYNSLRAKIILSGSITQGDKILLEALEKEWITNWWKFTHEVQVTEAQEVPHGQWLTSTNPKWEILAWYTRIWVWKAINSTTP